MTTDQRVGYIEGRLDSLATKEDMANLRTELARDMTVHLRWMIGLQLAGLTAIAAVFRLLG